MSGLAVIGPGVQLAALTALGAASRCGIVAVAVGSGGVVSGEVVDDADVAASVVSVVPVVSVVAVVAVVSVVADEADVVGSSGAVEPVAVELVAVELVVVELVVVELVVVLVLGSSVALPVDTGALALVLVGPGTPEANAA